MEVIMVKQKSIDNILEQLRGYAEDKEIQLDNENDRDYPNEEKLEKLESQIEVLNNAIEALEDYEA
jgi:peptidoglycan hydrolase CwlO-like protein